MAQDTTPGQNPETHEDSTAAREQDQETPQQSPQQMAAEMAKAFQELARGERTASALESQLDGIESRIEQLLASMESNAHQNDDDGNASTTNTKTAS